ncbi:hypothetical protein BDZ91DRAFT_783400 [Kalaharituber pfeilii]|nr:hypothetical protein BDZ91DRAFT_783400 [Kalaharituber pfeilii]
MSTSRSPPASSPILILRSDPSYNFRPIRGDVAIPASTCPTWDDLCKILDSLYGFSNEKQYKSFLDTPNGPRVLPELWQLTVPSLKDRTVLTIKAPQTPITFRLIPQFSQDGDTEPSPHEISVQATLRDDRELQLQLEDIVIRTRPQMENYQPDYDADIVLADNALKTADDVRAAAGNGGTIDIHVSVEQGFYGPNIASFLTFPTRHRKARDGSRRW